MVFVSSRFLALATWDKTNGSITEMHERTLLHVQGPYAWHSLSLRRDWWLRRD